MTTWDTQDIKTWPPGALMLHDNRPLGGTRTDIGVVVANDGIRTIAVVWDASCFHSYREYDVKVLHPDSIARVG